MGNRFLDIRVPGLSYIQVLELFYGQGEYFFSSFDVSLPDNEYYDILSSINDLDIFEDEEEHWKWMIIIFFDTPDGTVIRFVPEFDLEVNDLIAERVCRIIDHIMEFIKVKIIFSSEVANDYLFYFLKPENFDYLLGDLFIEPSEEKVHSDENPEKHPWDMIDECELYKDIVKYWCKGDTNSEIAVKVGRDSRTVTNILSKLRIKYGEDIVKRRKGNIIL